MTTLLTQTDNVMSQSGSQQEVVEESSFPISKVMELPCSNQVKMSSLLAKRVADTELGDLLIKRIKTQSTNTSENGSLQHSPTSKKSVSLGEKERISLDSSPTTVFTRCSSYETSAQDSFPAWSVSIDIDSQSNITSQEETQQLSQALDILKERMIEQEASCILQMIIREQLLQEPLFIPPFVEQSSNLLETLNRKEKKQNTKKDAQKMETELEFSYGSIEFPFLSLSTPFPEDGNLNRLPELEIPQPVNDLSKKLASKESIIDEKPKQEKKASIKKILKKKQVDLKEEKNLINKKISMLKVIKPAKEEKVQKKNNESVKATEKPKAEKQQKQENIYLRPALAGKRLSKRTKNKWQIAQDEKVKDIVLPTLNFNPSYELFFSGNKKKYVPVGPEYQVDVSTTTHQSTSTGRRKPQMKWNPETHSESELNKFFNKVESIINDKIHQERVLEIVLENNNDLKRALKHISANKSKCLKTLSVKVPQ